MIDKREKFCGDQVRRLSGLDFFPNDDYARAELVKSLWRNSESNAHAERIIDTVLKNGFGSNGRSCPTPAELADVATSVNPDERRPVASATCSLCFGTGWAEAETVAAEGAFAGQKYRAVKPCSCRRHLRAVS